MSEFTFDQFQKRDVNIAAGLVGIHLHCCDQLYPVGLGKLLDQPAMELK
jgi:hypothetical protein